MKFTHGSKINILDSEYENLDVFDYNIDNKGNPSLPFIDNGNDGEGIGIYAFIGANEETIKNASCYTSENSAFVYILDVDVKEKDLMHNRDPDEIPLEELAEVIDSFVYKRRDILGYNKDIYDELVLELYDRFDDNLDLDSMNKLIEKKSLNIRFDEFCLSEEFSNADNWVSFLDDHYSINDPCYKVAEEGGSLAIAQYAVERSYNLWETIKSIGHIIAVNYSNSGTERLNKTFKNHIVSELTDKYNLTATYVNNNNFAVIFDTSMIKIEKTINLNLKNDINEIINKYNPQSIKNQKNSFNKI